MGRKLLILPWLKNTRLSNRRSQDFFEVPVKPMS